MRKVALLILLVCISASAAEKPSNATSKAGSKGKPTYVANCAMCHGADGTGSAMGRNMGVVSLKSQAVKKRPDADLVNVVANGKGNMPPWKGSLTEAQIKDVVAYVRVLQGGAAPK